MLNMEEKIKVFKALDNKTRFEIFKNVLNAPYICGINTKVSSDDIIVQATYIGTIVSEFNYSLPIISRNFRVF